MQTELEQRAMAAGLDLRGFVGGGTPAPLPAIPSQGSYPHVRELQRSELRNATTYAPTHAPSAHHTTSGLPTSNFSWPAHDC